MNISSATVALNLAEFKSQALGSLMSSAFDAGHGTLSGLATLFSSARSAPAEPSSRLGASSSVAGASTVGRNMALADPESAYRMMSLINKAEVDYKAQFSEMSQLKSHVAQMQDAGRSLGSITSSTGNDGIAAQLQGFVTQYNDWIRRFDPDMEVGGILAGTQAAQISRYELDQSIDNIFNGAKDGLRGLADLGLTTDPHTNLAMLDTAKLGSVLAGNRQGAVDALRQFSANFAAAAEMLNSSGNFIPNRLDNLSRAIRFIDENEASLQAEFGTGAAARPTGRVAQALAAYEQAYNS